MQQLIEDYLLGKLKKNEIDKLWIIFISQPDWYEYFLIEYSIRRIGHINNMQLQKFKDIIDQSC